MLQNQQPENNDPQQPQPQDKGEKKRSKPFSLKAENFEARNGLRKLYQFSQQVNWADQMTIESAMNLVAVSLKTWHYQMAPKYSYDYFLQRCQSLGNSKILSAYMSKVRRIHRGLDKWDEVEGENQEKGQKQDLGINLTQQLLLAHQMGENAGNGAGNAEELDDLMDEDLRMFEEMNRRRGAAVEEEEGVELDGEIDVGLEFDGYDYD